MISVPLSYTSMSSIWKESGETISNVLELGFKKKVHFVDQRQKIYYIGSKTTLHQMPSGYYILVKQ